MREKKLRFLIFAVAIMLLVVGSSVFRAEAQAEFQGEYGSYSLIGGTTWYVDDDRVDYPNASFRNIQDAIDAADDGDTIKVFPGRYNENVIINKKVRILSTDGPHMTIIKAADAQSHVVDIRASGAVLNGFTLTGATGDKKSGIYIGENHNDCLIRENISTGNFAGLGLFKSYRNIITKTILENNKYGIGLTEGASGSCAVEDAVSQSGHGSDHEATGALGTLFAYRSLRDNSLKQEYIDAYYQYSPFLCRIFLHRPDLALNVYKVLKEYAPAILHSVNSANGHDLIVNPESSDIIIDLSKDIKAELSKLFDQNSAELNKLNTLIDQFISEFSGFVGRSFVESLRSSVYFDAVKMDIVREISGEDDGLVQAERTLQMVIPPGANENYIYQNNIHKTAGNTVYADKWHAVWNSPSPIAYYYDGRQYINFIGNYYHNYSGADNSPYDGIGDKPFPIEGTDASYDYYPLMRPYQNYNLDYVEIQSTANSGKAPLGVTLYAESPIPQTYIQEYWWDIDNDGIYEYITGENSVQHIYEEPGYYMPTVIAKVMHPDIGSFFLSSEAIEIAVLHPSYVSGEMHFAPYYPQAGEPSVIMEGGKAIRYYKVCDKNYNSLAKVAFSYRFEGSDNCFATTTDGKGFVAIETDKVYQDRNFILEVLNSDGATVKEDVFNAPEFRVETTERTFEQDWSILIGGRGSVGVGGPSAKIGKMEFNTVEAGLEGGLARNIYLKYQNRGEQTDVTLGNNVDASLKSKMKAGIFAKVWGENKSPKLDVGLKGSARVSTKIGIEGKFDDFLADPSDEQLLATSVLFLETVCASNPMPNPLMDRIWSVILDKVDLKKYNTLKNEFSVGLEGGAGTKLTFGPTKGSEIDLDLVGAKGKSLYTYSTSVPACPDPDPLNNKTETKQSFINEGTLALFKLGLNKQFSDSAHESLPDCSLKFDIIGLDRIYDVTNTIELEKINGVSNKLKLSKSLPGDVDWGIGFLTIARESTFCLDLEGKDKINQLAGMSRDVRNFIDGKYMHVCLDSVDDIFRDAYNVSGGADWSIKDTDSTMFSESFDISLGSGLKLGLGIDITGKSSFGFDAQRGKILSPQENLKLEMYDDVEVKNNKKSITDFLNVFSRELEKVIKDAKDFIHTVINNIKDGVVNAGAYIVGVYDNVLGSITKVTPVLRSYQIFALPNEYEIIETAPDSLAFKAMTVGDVYIINLVDENQQPLTDFSVNPVSLTIDYNDAMLGAVGLTPGDAQKLAIYCWDGSLGYYIYQSSRVDEENRQVSADITKPGQYILAIDESNPIITDFMVSDRTPTPVITANITDDLSGIDLSNFIFKIDGELKVTEINLSSYYNINTGVFRYRVDDPLSDGIHIAEILVGDTAGNLSDTEQLIFEVRSIPPVIIHDPVAMGVPGQDIPVNSVIIDDTQLLEVYLLYKVEGSHKNYVMSEMINIGGDDYLAFIPKEYLTGNILYDIVARDVDGNETRLPVPVLINISDNVRPAVVSTNLTSRSVLECVTQPIIIEFNKDILPGYDFDDIICLSKWEQVYTLNRIVDNRLIIEPVDTFSYGTEYEIYLPADSIRDKSGNSMSGDYDLDFSTGENINYDPFVFPTETDVPTDKVWVIVFNQELETNRNNEHYIKVITDYGESVNVSSEPGGDGRSIVVQPPPQGYEPNQTYYLLVERGILSAEGRHLSRPAMIQFITADKEFDS